MNYLRWFAANILFAVFLYLGLVEKIAGAWNVAVFYIYFCAVISLFTFSDIIVDALREKIDSGKKYMPRVVDVTYDIILSGVLVWFGHIWLGSIYFIHMVLCSAAWEKAKKPKETEDNEESA